MIKKIETIVRGKKFLESLEITGEVAVSEIRKGKVNHIFKLTDTDKDVSYILKKSEKKLAGLDSPVASGFDISVLRNYNEARVLKYISENISDMYVPKVMMVNEEEAFFVMEYLEGYEDVRDMLLNMNVPKNFAEALSDILVDIYVKTANVTEEVLGIDNRCMIDVLVMLLAKAPYEVTMVKVNKALIDNEFFAKVLEEKELLPYAMKLAYKLKSCKQALLNGDLHLGSIFCNESSYKIYDYEFAFKGPIGYELGKVIAHFVLAYHYALSVKNYVAANGILNQMEMFFDRTIGKIEQGEVFSNSSIKEDTVKFCGLELISRVTGILQLKYVIDISDTTIKDKVQKKLFRLGSEMIKGKVKITTGKEFADYVREQ